MGLRRCLAMVALLQCSLRVGGSVSCVTEYFDNDGERDGQDMHWVHPVRTHSPPRFRHSWARRSTHAMVSMVLTSATNTAKLTRYLHHLSATNRHQISLTIRPPPLTTTDPSMTSHADMWAKASPHTIDPSEDPPKVRYGYSICVTVPAVCMHSSVFDVSPP